MTRHDLLLVSLGIWVALLAMATVQLAQEVRWRRRCTRRERLPKTAASDPEKP